ncbi:MAG: hypothetical protein FJZ00_09080, partial [Candidatus Sericytochromatia bacterium]|nr:hypothetical protein [Candidatus Tanganyikabacteria bacterium]
MNESVSTSGDVGAALWPPELDAGSGSLVFDGCDLEALAADRGTPLWVTSRQAIERHFESLRSAFAERYENCEVAYSMKANNNAAIVALLHRLGALLDCSAEYEFQLALLAGVPPEDIILNGNGKGHAALESAVKLGVRQVNVDSLGEAKRLAKVSAAEDKRVCCAVRVQLTYRDLLAADPSFETTLRIGEGKFGANIASGEAMATVRAIEDSSHLDFVGFHHHVGFAGYMSDYTPEREVMHHEE